MRITARVDYAILAVFELALHAKDRRMQARELAEQQQIPLRFLEQILIQLKKAGLVESARGSSGGYMLAQQPDQISLAEIITAVEGEVTLIDSRVNPGSVLCEVWKEIGQSLVTNLEAISVQDLIRRKIQQEQVIVYHI